MSNRKPSVYPLVIANSIGALPYLSIGMVTAYLRQCEKGDLAKRYDIKPISLGGIPDFALESLYTKIHAEPSPICLLSSYVWNHELNLEVASHIKVINPSALIIVGGPEIPKYIDETEAFLKRNPYIDIAVLGEGEVACAAILSTLNNSDHRETSVLRSVAGIVYREQNELIRTEERARITDVNALPSPYLTKEFDPWFKEFSSTILETNRGCPYGCTYCDWGSATLQKVTKFSPARVIAEIEYIAEKKSRAIFIADANFGMLEQDIEISQALVDVRARTGYPKRLYTNFAKNGGRRLMTAIKLLHEGGLLPTGIIALQTTDDDTLKAIKRDNIKTSAYEKMMEYFNSENIPMASDIMIGLPGQTIESLQKDLQFCFDWKVSANGNYTSMMPNAPMAEKSYMAEHNIVIDNESMIASTSSFSRQDLFYMKCLYMTYQFHVRLGVLKYYLYYLQIEHSVPALTLLRRWLDASIENNSQIPISNRLYREVFAMESRSGHWALMSWGEEASFFFQDIEAYYQEFHSFTCREFSIDISASELDAIFTAQAAVTPRLGRNYPYTVALPHDVQSYFEQLKSVSSLAVLQEDFVPLIKHQANELKVTPKIKRKKSIKFAKIDGHSDDWELPSALRFY